MGLVRSSNWRTIVVWWLASCRGHSSSVGIQQYMAGQLLVVIFGHETSKQAHTCPDGDGQTQPHTSLVSNGLLHTAAHNWHLQLPSALTVTPFAGKKIPPAAGSTHLVDSDQRKSIAVSTHEPFEITQSSATTLEANLYSIMRFFDDLLLLLPQAAGEAVTCAACIVRIYFGEVHE